MLKSMFYSQRCCKYDAMLPKKIFRDYFDVHSNKTATTEEKTNVLIGQPVTGYPLKMPHCHIWRRKTREKGEDQLVDDGVGDEADTDDDHLCELQTSVMTRQENDKDGQGGNGRRL